MAKSSRWTKTSWPWELEIITIFFLLIALLLPLYIEYTTPVVPIDELTLTEQARLEQPYTDTVKALGQQKNMVVGLSIAGAYIGYLVLALLSNRMISTSFLHLIAPVVFAVVAYFRLKTYNQGTEANTQMLVGTWWEPIVWFGGTFLLCILIALLRKKRHLGYFQEEEWIETMPNRKGKGSISPGSLFAWLYPVNSLRISENGILVEGHLYILPLSFRKIKSIVHKRTVSMTSSDYNLATRKRDLVRVQLTSMEIPYILSPQDPDRFIQLTHDTAPSSSHLFSSDATQTSSGTTA